MDIVLLILLILVLFALVFLYGKWQSLALLLQDQAEDTADSLSDQLSYQLENATLKQQQAIHQEVERLRTELYQQLTDIRQELNKSHLETRDATDRRLQAIQESNEKRLEEMRQTVEEKLETVTDYAREHKHFSFRTLLGSQKSKMQTVVTFLAVLQLIKEGILIVQQEHAFDDIMITANL